MARELQGFPEAAYYGMAEQLARKGHRVVVVEQVCMHADAGSCGGLIDRPVCVILDRSRWICAGAAMQHAPVHEAGGVTPATVSKLPSTR